MIAVMEDEKGAERRKIDGRMRKGRAGREREGNMETRQSPGRLCNMVFS